MEKGQIPPSANYNKPNPKLELDKWGLRVATELEPWPVVDGMVRRASINNFGYGGTNAHIILEEAPPGFNGPSKPTNGSTQTSHTLKNEVLVFYGRDEQACERMVAGVKQYLQRHRDTASPARLMRNLGWTLAKHRTRFPTGWVSAHLAQYSDSDLDVAIQSLDSPGFKPVRLPSKPVRIGMVFTGQGAQWHAMARELAAPYPVVRATLDEAELILKELGANWSLTEELLARDAATSRVHHTEFSIPVCVAVQIALVRLLRVWGIEPTAVTSHSSGEIAAAYAVGALDLRQAMAAAYYRAVMAWRMTQDRGMGVQGAMAAVGVGEAAAHRDFLDKLLDADGTAVVACINSPSSVTISGDERAVERVLDLANEAGVFARRIKVPTAYHSHHMNPLAEPYRQALAAALAGADEDNKLSVSFSSPVTGGRITNGKQLASADHWVASLLQPVQFIDAFTDMVLGGAANSGASNIDVILEVGPHTALGGPIKELLSQPAFQGVNMPYVGCLVRNENARDCMLATGLDLVRKGYPVSLPQLRGCAETDSSNMPPRVLTDLPPYPWNHSIGYWNESRYSRAYRQRDRAPNHLLGLSVPGTNPEAATWRQIVRLSESPWLRDHVVQGNVLYPGAGFVCLAIEAMKQLAKGSSTGISDMSPCRFKLQDVEIHQALLVPDNADGIEVQTVLRHVDDKTIGLQGWRQFEVLSVTADNHWTQHAKGLITTDFSEAQDKPTTQSPVQSSGFTRRIEPEELWSNLRSLNIQHGPHFQNITSIVQEGKTSKNKCCMTTFDIADCDIQCKHVLHPTTLDSVIVSTYAALPGAGAQSDSPMVPRSIRSLWVSSGVPTTAGSNLVCNANVVSSNSLRCEADITVVHAGRSVLEVEGLLLQSLGSSVDPHQERQLCANMRWAPELALSAGLPGAAEAIKAKLRAPLAVDANDEVVLIRLRRVCVYFCHDALAALTGQDVSKLLPHHVKFYGWMQDTLAAAAARRLAPASDTWTHDPPATRAHEMALAAVESNDGELICRLGSHLVPILRGEQAPLEVMLKDRLLHRYYAQAFRLAPAFVQFRALMRAVAHRNPRARVLEIGAGTGGATRNALQALGTDDEGGPFIDSWHFTDISSGFFEAAHAEFVGKTRFLDMHFDRCDIEQDPAAQGFDLESYDIVVACQVLHATRSMERTMAHVRSLMKPGASLLLMETTKDQIDMQFIFGLLPGWWLSEEPERVASPTLSLPMWQHALKAAGFSGIDVELRDYEADEDMYSVSNIVSTALAPPTMWQENSVVVVISSRAPPPAAWLESLRVSIAGLTGGALPVVYTLETGATKLCSGKFCISIAEADQALLHDINAMSLEGLKSLGSNARGLLWVTRGAAIECAKPEMALAQGLLRVLRNEYAGRACLSLDLDPEQPAWSGSSASTIVHIMKNCLGSRQDNMSTAAEDSEYAVRDGLVMVPRIYKDVSWNKFLVPEAPNWFAPESIPEAPLFQDQRPLSLQVGILGLLDTLAFDDDPHYKGALATDEIEIKPCAYGLNFRDVMVAMDELREPTMGIECAGIVTRLGPEATAQGFAVGDAVMALLLGPSFASRARISWHGVAHVPRGMDFNDAASLPIIFVTAYVSLIEVARLRQGQSVLIHSAAGGVGQAAIKIAKDYLGAEVYVTVGSQEKRELLVREYNIPTERIFNSRDTSFAPAVLAATGGVDVVLNSSSGSMLQASFDILAPYGHFVEIGKRDLENNSLLAMGTFSRVASFTSVDILSFLRHRGADAHRILNEIARLVGQGVLRPVSPVKAYPMRQLSQAFRLLQTGKHVGKVVLSVAPDEQVKVLPQVPTPKLRPDASYLIVGGVGGLGRSIAHWFVDHGATNLILLSRSAGDARKTDSFVTGLREAGCCVVAISCDVSNKDDLARTLDRCRTDEKLPPIRGVVQGAMVLQDSILENMTLDDWQAAVKPKVAVTWNIHTHFAQPGSLDFFVMLSSVSATLGWASQANYAAGGSYQDAFARWRCSIGLPAVSLDLGMVKGVGYVSESRSVLDRVDKSSELIPLSDEDVTRALGVAVLDPFTQPQVLLGLNSSPGPHWDPANKSAMGRDARFLPLRYRQAISAASGQSGTEVAATPLSTRLKEAGSNNEAERLVGDAIAAKLADIFMIPLTEIDLAQSPAWYGIDSLVAVELRNMLMLQADADISIFDILQSASLSSLIIDAVAKSAYVIPSIEVAVK
ncbi:Polyketide synthase phosphopantetheine-binding domain [Pyrenophora tritici-repentis]|nr:Polyketide synthase phosphopantetheine-binding domain [Pyrenophora tritici-repentis]KAI0605226.1 Polyketide synthase phosphopantetheine-binding domain [Pyrenophora tritici-repentis]KAI0617488.1 Polyketide synthase phosphopantetheine-binding domain [Pyrenophora tritici-repentis]